MSQVIDVPPTDSGPCVLCGESACFCALCLKLKAGKRLCRKCFLKAKELGVDAQK
jgi:hypothetical protein